MGIKLKDAIIQLSLSEDNIILKKTTSSGISKTILNNPDEKLLLTKGSNEMIDEIETNPAKTDGEALRIVPGDEENISNHNLQISGDGVEILPIGEKIQHKDTQVSNIENYVVQPKPKGR